MGTFQKVRPGDRMLAVEEAQQRVLDAIVTLGEEEVAFTEAHGRVLREDVRATRDLPPADNSAMDGYAVRADDIATVPVRLRVIDDIAAGRIPTTRVEPGTASRIMTGGFIPEGADTVVQVELTDAGSDAVVIQERLPRGTNVRGRGEDMRAGQIVLEAGFVVDAAAVGVLASVQKSAVRVGRRPAVAILATGDEIADARAELAPGQVVNSNSYSLAALAAEAGALPRRMPVVRDTREATISAIESALDSDVVISSGGVSAGAFDFVKDALDALGAETSFWKVAMKPGKPVVFARLRERVYFGLPGNPVSCMVAFHLFVAPALRKAAGQKGSLFPPRVHARAGAPIRSKGDRRVYLRVRVVARDGELIATPAPAQGSHISTSMLSANGLAVVEAGETFIEAGGVTEVLLIGNAFSA